MSFTYWPQADHVIGTGERDAGLDETTSETKLLQSHDQLIRKRQVTQKTYIPRRHHAALVVQAVVELRSCF